MAVQVQCPTCRTSISVSPEHLGQMFQCGSCGNTFAATSAAPSGRPWYLRWYVWAGAGGGALLLLLIVVGVVLALVFSDTTTEPVAAETLSPETTPVDPEPPTPTQPVKKVPTISITAATDATIEPGRNAMIDIKINRDGIKEPIQISAAELPEKVSAQNVEVAGNKNAGQLTIVAAADAPETSQPVRIVASVGDVKAEHIISLTVKRVLPPVIVPIALVNLKPGATAIVDIQVERNGHEGAIAIQVEGLSDQVTANPLSIAEDQSAGKLEIAAAGTAPEKQQTVRVLATIAERVGESELQLVVENFPFRVKPIAFPVVWLKPGESAMVDVNVERRSYKGPLEIKLEGLPEQMTAAPATIPADQLTTKVELKAAESAEDRVRSAKIVAAAEGKVAQEVLITRVKKGEGMLLTNVKVDPELERLLKRGSFGGRLTVASKQQLIEIFGGTQESEAAVLEGLRWLADHQAKDGSWSLNGYGKVSKECDCKVDSEKEVDKNDTAAIAFGLLPFLGAGVTPHKAPESPQELSSYTDNVTRGLVALIRNQTTSNDDNNGNLGGGMYAHALGTIALCEAYALTNDQDLRIPAQKAVRYLVKAQHGGTGGWGYGRVQEGDTSVVGWVFLAIRSGQMSGMLINARVLELAERFLNSTASGPDDLKRSRYTYKPGGQATPALTAAGLLSRQYLGWQATRPELPAGAAYLMENLPPIGAGNVGPSYYYYYATQVLHHLEGKNWDYWNHRMREHLIRTQEKEGHKKGSWSPNGSDWGARGGRMYTTSLSLLTLEVYYRHLPLYRKVPRPNE